MNLLDQMKAQAQKMLELKNSTGKLSAEEFAQRNAKLKIVSDYWHEFSALIKVIQPDFVHPIALPGIGEIWGLKVVDATSDCRHSSFNNQEVEDEIINVSLYFFYKAHQRFEFTKEISAAERIKDVLWRYGIVHEAEDVRNDQARIVKVAFNIPWEVRGSIVISPLPNPKVISLVLKNVVKLGDVAMEVSYDELDTDFLDELSKLLLGQENHFWKLVKF